MTTSRGLISEAARADMYTGLTEVLGRNRAETLMAYLPTFDPVDIATKADVAELRADLGQRLDRLEESVGRLEQRMDGLEARMDGLEHRMDALEARMDALLQRSDVVDERFELINGRFDLVDQRLDDMALRFGSIDGHLLALGKRIDRLYYILVAGVFAIIAAMAGLVTFRA